jgi:hypothetical protein
MKTGRYGQTLSSFVAYQGEETEVKERSTTSLKYAIAIYRFQRICRLFL